MSTTTSDPTSRPEEKDDKLTESSVASETASSSGASSSTSAASSGAAAAASTPASRSNNAAGNVETSSSAAISSESPGVLASSAASPAPLATLPGSKTATNVVESSSSSSAAAISTDSLCLVQIWSHDDDSVYTGDGFVNHCSSTENKQQMGSPSLIANEPLDFGSIFRTIHAMRCPQPQKDDNDDADNGNDQQLQQGQHEDTLTVASPLDSSFAYADSDTVTSTEKGGCETRLSYTRSFIEQMMSDSCASADSNSNLGTASDSKTSNLDYLKPSRSLPFSASSSTAIMMRGFPLALDLTTTDEDDDDNCDGRDYESDAYEVQSSTNGGYDSIMYDEESNANVSMLSAKTPVTKNGTKSTKTKNTGASHVVDQLEDIAVGKSGGGGGVAAKSSSFSKDKQAWLYQHRRKVFILLGLLVVVFGLVIVVMVLSHGESGMPTAEASSVDDSNNGGAFTIPDNFNFGGTLLDSTDQDGNTTMAIPEANSSNSTTTIINIMTELNLTTFPTALLKARASPSSNESPSLLYDTAPGSLQTVFAPFDSAFDEALSAGIITNKILHDKEWGLHLDKLLRHHMVLDSVLLTDQLEEQVAASSLTDQLEEQVTASSSSNGHQQQQYLTMASGEKVALRNKTKADGVPNLVLGNEGEVSFVKANVRADNGVVHVINGLLRPKFLSMTVMDILEQKQNLSTFARLIVLAGLDDSLRNVDAGFTVFAPNNDAFDALHPMTMTLLQSNDGREVLTETLQRHLQSVVLPTTNDVVPVGSTAELASGGLLLSKDASGVMSINGATFTARDALAVNGLVHSIESVLLPTSAMAVTTPAPALSIPSLAPVHMPTEVACANFECPLYMEAKPNQECQESIADCQCITGYEMQQDGSCVMCSFQCPNNSRRRENRQCWSNMDDCTCSSGYQKNGNTCVQTNVDQFVKRCMYSCPPNSSKRSDRNCIDSFADCQCNPGHISISIGCI